MILNRWNMINIKYLEESSFEECLKQGYFEDKKIVNNPNSSLILDRVYFDNCYFENIDFTKFKVLDINVDNCVFKNCDFSNILFDEKVIFRSSFITCKLQGTFFSSTKLEDVEFNDINGRYINFSGCNLKKVNFSDCDFTESRFMECDTQKMTLSNVNFNKAELIKMKLQNTDFSSSNIDNIITGRFNLNEAEWQITSLIVQLVADIDKTDILYQHLSDDFNMIRDYIDDKSMDTLDNISKYWCVPKKEIIEYNNIDESSYEPRRIRIPIKNMDLNKDVK